MKEYKNILRNYHVISIDRFIRKVVNFGSSYDLRKFDHSDASERCEVMKAFFCGYIRKIMQENNTERDYISIDSFDINSLRFEVKQSLGRTNTNMKARCYAAVSVVDFDEQLNEVSVRFRVMEPVKAISSNAEGELDPEEFTSELRAATDNFATWLTETAELIEFKMTDPSYQDVDELQVLELFYTTLRRFGMVKLSTETVICLARMYPRICYRFPSFKEASNYKKAEVLHAMASKTVSGDPHVNAKNAFYALYDAGMVDRFMYRPDWYGSPYTYTMKNSYEGRGDRYPVGLRNEDERKRGWYLIKNDLLWIMFEYVNRGGYKMRCCLKPFDLWHTLAEGMGGDNIQEY